MFLVIAVRGGRKVTHERSTVFEATTTKRRLRRMGWLVAVMPPGAHAPRRAA